MHDSLAQLHPTLGHLASWSVVKGSCSCACSGVQGPHLCQKAQVLRLRHLTLIGLDKLLLQIDTDHVRVFVTCGHIHHHRRVPWLPSRLLCLPSSLLLTTTTTTTTTIPSMPQVVVGDCAVPVAACD